MLVVSALFPLVCLLLYPVSTAELGARGVRFIALHGALTALCALAWWAAQRATEREWRWTLWSGIASRLLLFAVPAFLSHDVARYLWDGYLVSAGLDPYRLTPAAASALYLGWPPVADNRQITAVYPPAATALYTLIALAGPTLAPWLWRALMTGCSVALLLVTDTLLRQSDRRRHLPWVALSPLLIVESQVGGHIDVLSALALLVALYLYRRQRLLHAGLAIGLGTAIKLLPALVLLPAIAIDGRRALIRSGSAIAAVLTLFYGGALLRGLTPLGGLDSFFGKCQFGSPIYAALAAIAGPVWSRVALALLFVIALLAILRWARQSQQFERAVLYTIAAPLLFTPVVYPWYLMALVPLTALYRQAWVVGWVVTLPITYEVIDRFDASNVWEPAAWPLLVVALSWVLGGLFDVKRWNRARAQ